MYALLEICRSSNGKPVRARIAGLYRVCSSAGYPLAEGSRLFLARNTPLISKENFEKLKAMLGLCASIASAILVTLRWFRGEPLSAS